jgi:uncharacterized membrane protein YvlD (DUF360 family)
MVLQLLSSWIWLTLCIWATAVVFPGFTIKQLRGALVVAATLGLLHLGIGWFLFSALGFATLGLGFLLAFVTRWVLTAIALKLADTLSDNLKIRGFGAALLVALIMSLLGGLGELFVSMVG